MAETPDFEAMEEYEPVIVDLDGEQFELIDTVEVDGGVYAALTPYSEEDELPEDGDVEFIILEVIDEGDEEQLTLKTVDDEELYSKVGDAFIALFEDEFDDDEA